MARADQPYTVKNEAAECINGFKETIYRCEIKLVGRQRLFNGTMTYGEDMASDHFKYQIEIFNAPAGDKQFKRLPLGVPRTAICEGFRAYYGDFLQPSLIHGENTDLPYMPEEGLCPFPKGEYWFKNLPLNTDAWPEQIPRGFVKAVITYFKDGVDVGGLSVTLRIEDRE
ncbi:uncharacterized protein LOC118745250 [Rhagoletis pomonella]|uniref:uncharacterized protein LOC118745250 n=1 Tax=Rhagoletis pomonella TaxID=28610 RepID=UPI001785816D|nr:uncharacterized protein LOC118745250 [Rhagoletis pomonella]